MIIPGFEQPTALDHTMPRYLPILYAVVASLAWHPAQSAPPPTLMEQCASCHSVNWQDDDYDSGATIDQLEMTQACRVLAQSTGTHSGIMPRILTGLSDIQMSPCS